MYFLCSFWHENTESALRWSTSRGPCDGRCVTDERDNLFACRLRSSSTLAVGKLHSLPFLVMIVNASLRYEYDTDRLLACIFCAPPGIKTRNLHCSRRHLVGLVMGDVLRTNGAISSHGRLRSSSTLTDCKLHSLPLMVLTVNA